MIDKFYKHRSNSKEQIESYTNTYNEYYDIKPTKKEMNWYIPKKKKK